MEFIITGGIEHGRFLFPLVALAAGACVFLMLRSRRGPRPLRWAASTLCAALIVASCFGFYFSTAITSTIERRARDFSFRLVDDDSPRTLADYASRVVVLNFWATWCDPCREEMPDLERLADRYTKEGVVVLTVSDEARERLRAAAPSAKVLRVSAYFKAGQTSGPIQKLACGGRPTTLVVDRAGRIRDVLIGQHTYESFENKVRRAL